ILLGFIMVVQDVKCQFMNTVLVKEMPLNLTYTHLMGKNSTMLYGNLAINERKKVSAKYAEDYGNCKLKYSYRHKAGTTIEPSFDFATNSWDFAVSQRIPGTDNDVLSASYDTWLIVLKGG
ncbi:hypothetical protein CFOL_v3_13004, partial [Cephalotus follicularis]